MKYTRNFVFNALACCAMAIHSPPVAAANKVLWSDGHGDLGVSYFNGAWIWSAHEGLPPSEVIIDLRDNARLAIPANPNFAFLGAAGEPIWIIPFVQQRGIPFMGANHELTPPGTFLNNRFDLKLSRVSGPGDFVLWTVSGGGLPTVLLNSRDGIDSSDKASVPAPGHWHQNWGFTAPGTYQVGFIASGVLAPGGQTVSSGEEVYTFAVGVLRRGEADIEVAYENGELQFHVHDKTTDTELEPAHVALHAGPASWQAVPADPAFSFFGRRDAGLMVLPQDENPEVLFLGLAAAEIPAGVFAGDALEVRLAEFSGPGDFFYYEVDALGAPTVRFNTADGLGAADVVTLKAGSHAHRNWAFTAPGVYRLTLVASGQRADGGRVTSAPAAFRFEVFPPALIQLSASRIAGNQLRIGWNTQIGATYRLRSRAGVAGGQWTDEGEPMTGNGQPATRDLPIAADAMKLFQVVRLP